MTTIKLVSAAEDDELTLPEFHKRRDAFRECRAPNTAADYLATLTVAYCDDLIDDKDMVDGIAEVAEYLQRPFPRQV